MTQVIVPYRDTGRLTQKQKYFNKTLGGARVVVEHAFGQLKQRFRQLYHCELRSLERIVKLIYACCVLHNMANTEELELLEAPEPEPEEDDSDLDSDSDDDNDENNYMHSNNENNNATPTSVRDSLCDKVWRLKQRR